MSLGGKTRYIYTWKRIAQPKKGERQKNMFKYCIKEIGSSKKQSPTREKRLIALA